MRKVMIEKRRENKNLEQIIKFLRYYLKRGEEFIDAEKIINSLLKGEEENYIDYKTEIKEQGGDIYFYCEGGEEGYYKYIIRLELMGREGLFIWEDIYLYIYIEKYN